MLRRIMIAVTAVAAAITMSVLPANAGPGDIEIYEPQFRSGPVILTTDVTSCVSVFEASGETFSEAMSADNRTPANSTDSRWLRLYNTSNCSGGALLVLGPGQFRDWFGANQADLISYTHFTVGLS